MTFPITPRYFVNFRKSDTGLTPTFVYFKNAATLANVTPPSITELSDGRYYFDWLFSTKNDADIIFQIDGGASIPTEEVRYVNGQLSPRDRFIDEPISQVVTDVWTDNTAYAAGQKGKRVDDIGAAADNSATASLFGKSLLYKESVRGDSAGTSDGNNVKQVYDRVGAPIGASLSADIAGVRGADNRDLTQLAGTGTFVPGTDNLHEIALDAAAAAAASAAAPTASQNAAAVWDEVISGGPHVVANSSAVVLKAAALETTAQAIKTKTDNLPADTNTLLNSISSNLTRALGMLHENSVMDQTSFTPENNLLTGRLRIYNSKANADAAWAVSPATYDTGKVGEYAIVATYNGTNLKTYKVSREA